MLCNCKVSPQLRWVLSPIISPQKSIFRIGLQSGYTLQMYFWKCCRCEVLDSPLKPYWLFLITQLQVVCEISGCDMGEWQSRSVSDQLIKSKFIWWSRVPPQLHVDQSIALLAFLLSEAALFTAFMHCSTLFLTCICIWDVQRAVTASKTCCHLSVKI